MFSIYSNESNGEEKNPFKHQTNLCSALKQKSKRKIKHDLKKKMMAAENGVVFNGQFDYYVVRRAGLMSMTAAD